MVRVWSGLLQLAESQILILAQLLCGFHFLGAAVLSYELIGPVHQNVMVVPVRDFGGRVQNF